MRDPIVLLTMAGLAGLLILNPKAFDAAVSTIRGIITRALGVAAK